MSNLDYLSFVEDTSSQRSITVEFEVDYWEWSITPVGESSSYSMPFTVTPTSSSLDIAYTARGGFFPLQLVRYKASQTDTQVVTSTGDGAWGSVPGEIALVEMREDTKSQLDWHIVATAYSVVEDDDEDPIVETKEYLLTVTANYNTNRTIMSSRIN